MGAHSSLPIGSTASNHGKGRHRKQKHHRLEPYAWLGAGALTMGLGAAALTGAGVAQAADDGGSSSSSSSSSSGSDSRTPGGSSSSSSAGSKDDSSGGTSPSEKSEDTKSDSSASSSADTETKTTDDADDSAKDDESDSKTLKKAVAVEDVDTVETETVDTSEEKSAKKAVSVDLATPDETVEEIKATEPAADDPAPDVAAVALVAAAGTAKEEKVVAAVQEPEVTPGVEEPAASGVTLMSVAAESVTSAATATFTPVVDPAVTTLIPFETTSPMPVVALNSDATRLYVSTVNGLSVIDTATNLVVKTLAIDITRWQNAIISPDDKFLYVVTSKSLSTPGENGNYFEFSAKIVDLSSGTEIRNLPIPSASELNIALNPNGTRLYIQEYISRWPETSVTLSRIWTVDTVSKNVIGSFDAGTSGSRLTMIVSPDGKRLYMTAFGEEYSSPGVSPLLLRTIDISSGIPTSIVSEITLSGTLETSSGLAISPDGKRLYVLAWVSGDTDGSWLSVSTVNTETGGVVSEVRVPRFNEDAQNPNGTFINPADSASGIVLTPDGKKIIVFTGERTNAVDGPDEFYRIVSVRALDTATGKFSANAVRIAPNEITFLWSLIPRFALSADGKKLYLYVRSGSSSGEDTNAIAVIDTTKIGQASSGGIQTTHSDNNSFINGVNDVITSDSFGKLVSFVGDVAGFLGVKLVSTVVNFVASFITGIQLDLTGLVANGIQGLGEGLMAYAVKTKVGALYAVGAAIATAGYVWDLAHDTDFSDPGSTFWYAITHPIETIFEVQAAAIEVTFHVGSVFLGSLGGFFGLVK